MGGSFPHTWQGVLQPPGQDGTVCTVVQQLWLGNLVLVMVSLLTVKQTHQLAGDMKPTLANTNGQNGG